MGADRRRVTGIEGLGQAEWRSVGVGSSTYEEYMRFRVRKTWMARRRFPYLRTPVATSTMWESFYLDSSEDEMRCIVYSIICRIIKGWTWSQKRPVFKSRCLLVLPK